MNSREKIAGLLALVEKKIAEDRKDAKYLTMRADAGQEIVDELKILLPDMPDDVCDKCVANFPKEFLAEFPEHPKGTGGALN